jgi:hypothetical protein
MASRYNALDPQVCGSSTNSSSEILSGKLANIFPFAEPMRTPLKD